MLGSEKRIDMTQGTIWKQLAAFAAPLLLGLIFQQLYNTVDSIVVGKFVSYEALAAVGSIGSIVNTLVGFFSGLSTGATVVIARCFGARDDSGVHDAVHTTILMTLILSVVFTGLGIFMVPYMLDWVRMPTELRGMASQYLRIYFSGIVGLMVYNMGAGILRAVGDSRRPLYFLCFSAAVNTAGDLILVLVFHMGVAGVAYATIASQGISALLVIYVLSRADANYRLNLKHLKIHKPVLFNILKIGLPGALQSAFTSLSNVFVQSKINVYGSACMAGWASYGKLDQFALLPMQSISIASTTFVGQNLGAGNIPRAKRGVNTALVISLSCTASLMAPLMLFARSLLTLFADDPNVLDYGRLFVLSMSPFYLCNAAFDIYAGALRGAGESLATMSIMLFCFVVARWTYLHFITQIPGISVVPVALGYPFGWILCAILQFLYYRFSGWEKKQGRVLRR